MSATLPKDPLTGLDQRPTLEAVVARFLAEDVPFALVFLDVDQFKQVNDTHGHPEGDQMLCAFADAMCKQTRKNDLRVRLSGDEFVIVLLDPKDAEHAAERIRAAVAAALVALEDRFAERDGSRAMVGCSMGVAVSHHDGDTYSDLMKVADSKMYRFKKNNVPALKEP